MADTFRLGRLEELVLRAILRLSENAYGPMIRREIVERTGRDVSVGTLYTTLDRLALKGYVTTRMGDPTPERGGRAKKYFRIEARGIEALNQSHETIARMGGLVHVQWSVPLDDVFEAAPRAVGL
jgi:PadR family transcriptional regulator